MKWQIDLSKDSIKFIEHNHIPENEIIELVKLALLKFSGQDININIRKLKGKWSGFYRIVSGKLRIIIEFEFKIRHILIEKIDFRGSVYK
jgi:mRNA-degrading endonuclease RelE of RelBE toxin-antitoxin system